jgi:hypothetical protein
MAYKIKSKKIAVTINGKTKYIKADLFKLTRTLFNKPYGTKYTEKEMKKMGFEKKEK